MVRIQLFYGLKLYKFVSLCGLVGVKKHAFEVKSCGFDVDFRIFLPGVDRKRLCL